MYLYPFRLFQCEKFHIVIKRSFASRETKSHPEYCAEIVRRHDYENFLCTLLLPHKSRRAAFAIRAFNVELSQIRDIVSNITIGQMRMQFWRDTLENIYQDNPPHSPVAMELYRACKQHSLAKRWMQRLLDSREQQLKEGDRAFQTVEEVEQYAESTAASLHYLVLQCLGVTSVHADHAASHIGKAQGIVTLLRAVPHNASKQRVYLPMNLLVQHSVSQEDVIRGSREQKMKDLIFDVASVANQHLNMGRSLSKDVPKEAIIGFLPTVSCASYLKALQRADFDVFSSQLQQRNSWLPISLWFQKLKGAY